MIADAEVRNSSRYCPVVNRLADLPGAGRFGVMLRTPGERLVPASFRGGET